MTPPRRARTREHAVSRFSAGQRRDAEPDVLAVEEPLEIRVAGETLAVTMRTPGNDRQLAIGLAFAEGVLPSIDALGRVYHCGRTGDAGADNTIDMLPAPGSHLDPDLGNRRAISSSACGVCGRQTIDDLLQRCQPLPKTFGVTVERLLEGSRALAAAQPTFDATGATHAAVALDDAGTPLASAEDVGRHNAVDKVVGALLLEGRLQAAHILAVSGRTSFEIVQKATVARIPYIVGVSAPTSLAVDLATRMGITLAGFARGDTLNVYTHAERVMLPPT